MIGWYLFFAVILLALHILISCCADEGATICLAADLILAAIWVIVVLCMAIKLNLVNNELWGVDGRGFMKLIYGIGGLILGIFQILAYVFAGGFWMSDAVAIHALLNLTLYVLLVCFIVTVIIGGIKGEY